MSRELMEMGYKALKEQSLDQKAFASVFTPKSAENYLKNYLKPGDKRYMNRGMVMEMGYKALKEAMTGPFNKPNLPKLNNPMPQRPNPNTIRVPFDMDYIGPTKPPIFNKNTTSMTDAPPITNRDMMSGPSQQKNINIRRKPSTGRGIGGRSPGSVKEAMTNPLADQNPLRNPAQSQDPNRGLGLITLRLR